MVITSKQNFRSFTRRATESVQIGRDRACIDSKKKKINFWLAPVELLQLVWVRRQTPAGKEKLESTGHAIIDSTETVRS